MGGLGNQLFQIFTTIAYGIRTKRKIVFPYFKMLTTGLPRKTYWHSFLSSIKNMTTHNKELGYTNNDLSLFEVWYREENNFKYTEIPNATNFKGLVLFGYFQSPKFFDDYKHQIFTMIGIPEIKENILKEFPQYFATNGEHDGGNKTLNISMHFRRGDYKDHKDYHPMMQYEYYYNALMHMMMYSVLTNKINILYFCEKEDNQEVLEIIRQLKQDFENFSFIKVDDTIEDWKQMMIMSNCDHNIIANSSFSWWGAYFNCNHNKIVCYPSTWFGPAAKHDTSAMFPEDWIVIDSKNKSS